MAAPDHKKAQEEGTATGERAEQYPVSKVLPPITFGSNKRRRGHEEKETENSDNGQSDGEHLPKRAMMMAKVTTAPHGSEPGGENDQPVRPGPGPVIDLTELDNDELVGNDKPGRKNFTPTTPSKAYTIVETAFPTTSSPEHRVDGSLTSPDDTSRTSTLIISKKATTDVATPNQTFSGAYRDDNAGIGFKKQVQEKNSPVPELITAPPTPERSPSSAAVEPPTPTLVPELEKDLPEALSRCAGRRSPSPPRLRQPTRRCH